MTKKIKTFRIIRIILWVAIFLYTAITPVFIESDFSICISKILFNLDCPMCGMTRAFIAIEHLQFDVAFSLNPLVFIVYLLFLYCAIQDIYITVFKRKKYSFIEYMMGYSNYVDN